LRSGRNGSFAIDGFDKLATSTKSAYLGRKIQQLLPPEKTSQHEKISHLEKFTNFTSLKY
jgi:hypothetical protein